MSIPTKLRDLQNQIHYKPAFAASAGIAAAVLLLLRLTQPDGSLLLHLVAAAAVLFILTILSAAASRAAGLKEQLQIERDRREAAESALAEAKQRSAMLFNRATDAVFIHDFDGNFLEVNEMTAQHLGYTVDELMEINAYELYTLDDLSKVPERLKILRENNHLLITTAYARKDGTMLPVEVNAQLIDYAGRPAVLSVARDITHRKAVENSERELRLFAEALRDIAADLTSTLELEVVLDRILAHMSRVVQHDAASIMMVEGDTATITRHRGYVERGIGELIDQSHFLISKTPTLRVMAQTHKPIIIADVKNDPQWMSSLATYWIRSYAGAPINYKGEVIGFLNIDSSYPGFFTPAHAERLKAFADHAAVAIQNARLYAEVQHLAVVDELTGLYNRRGLFQIGQHEVDRAVRFRRPLAALLLDVDNFKQFNDQYSYAVGDEVLKAVAQRCKNAVRKVDVVGRYGGDEFVILLAENDINGAYAAAEHVREAILESPVQTSLGPLEVTVSIGLAAREGEDWDLAELIDAAGDANHYAKQGGRNRVASKPGSSPSSIETKKGLL